MDPEPQFPAITLRDGRMMAIRLATTDDVQEIAQVHELPTKVPVQPGAYRAHFHLKALLYVRVPHCGIVTGWIEGRLAGFQFYCSRLSGFRQHIRSLAGVRDVCAGLVESGLLLHPSFVVTAVRQGLQHIQPVNSYSELRGLLPEPMPDCAYGTLQTLAEYRRLGVGSALHEASSDVLRRNGNTVVLFWIAADNEASLRLHDNSGCTRIGVARRLNEDCWLLRKDLTQLPSAETPREET